MHIKEYGKSESLHTKMNLDAKFAQIINIKGIDYIYKQFFEDHVSNNDLLEAKNLSFKDLYNLMSENI